MHRNNIVEIPTGELSRFVLVADDDIGRLLDSLCKFSVHRYADEQTDKPCAERAKIDSRADRQLQCCLRRTCSR